MNVRVDFPLVVCCFFVVSVAVSGEPTAIDPHPEIRTREETFEFAQKPKIEKEGDTYVISFATTAKCDATIAIVNTEGTIVRHLASGILGENAPIPFKKGTLEQKIEWDGKDNVGSPVPTGCRVRVSLGLDIKYERSIGFHPAHFPQAGGAKAVSGFVPFKDGVYVIGVGWQIRLFDHKGNYVRTVMPFPPDTAPDKFKPIKFVKTVDGDKVPGYGVRFISSGGSKAFRFPLPRQSGCVLSDGRLMLFSDLMRNCHKADERGRELQDGVFYLGPDGSIEEENLASVALPAPKLSLDMRSIALSPDGKTACVAGHSASEVVSFRAGAKTEAVTFAGDPTSTGDDETHLSTPKAVAFDHEGNVLIADHGNNRIQVFSPKGTWIQTIPVERPEMLSVHRKTGDIYVLSVPSLKKTKGRNYPPTRLVKLGRDGKELAVYEISVRQTLRPVFAVDSWVEPAVIWFGSFDEKALSRIVLLTDNGDSFSPLPSPFDDIPWEDLWRTAGQVRQGGIEVDRLREEVYVTRGEKRYDGKTGVRDATWKGGIPSISKFATAYSIGGPDGFIHGRLGWGNYIGRLDRNRKVVPFPHGVPMPKREKKFSGIIDVGLIGPVSGNSGGMDVAENGDIYVAAWGFKSKLGWMGKVPRDKVKETMKKYPERYSVGSVDGLPTIRVWDKDGNLKVEDAVSITGSFSTIRVDARGNIYIGTDFLRAGQTCPLGLDPSDPFASKSYTNHTEPFWGTVFRLSPGHGRFRGDWHGRWKKEPSLIWDYPSTPPTHQWRWSVRVWAEDYDYDFPGHCLMISGAKGHACDCAKGNFDVDLFGRAFIPQWHLYSVRVLDPGGTSIMRVGRYGNMDCQGPGSMYPEPDIGLAFPNIVAVSDTALYIGDSGNSRILKAALSYAKEETLDIP